MANLFYTLYCTFSILNCLYAILKYPLNLILNFVTFTGLFNVLQLINYFIPLIAQYLFHLFCIFSMQKFNYIVFLF